MSAAGLVLAATFAALAVMPLPRSDRLHRLPRPPDRHPPLVRLFLVPALLLDLGPRTWWPTRLPGDSPSPDTSPRPYTGEADRPASAPVL
ncbi:hypothetical protein ACIF8W_18125 [Streptomyces sp. NPDC085639]|uniref:hypothetical protein n=1 Tax=Streptomyces sp. NPDC085639 TaxID=3365734 RepID=UPI0037D222CC